MHSKLFTTILALSTLTTHAQINIERHSLIGEFRYYDSLSRQASTIQFLQSYGSIKGKYYSSIRKEGKTIFYVGEMKDISPPDSVTIAFEVIKPRLSEKSFLQDNSYSDTSAHKTLVQNYFINESKLKSDLTEILFIIEIFEDKMLVHRLRTNPKSQIDQLIFIKIK